MCGIALIYHFDGATVSNDKLLAMNSALRHRGPDDDGTLVHKHAGLGHTRLSIVDIESGPQPLESSNGRYVISYNGEVYNYKSLREDLEKSGSVFKTRTDTEVILELYIKDGESCLDKLRGMFAFVILDRETGEVFVARDRLGIKPLYYYCNKDYLVAASEIKALFASGLVKAELQADSIRNYFTYQNAISPFTAFKDVYELPPGYKLSLVPGDKQLPVEPVCYWDIEFPVDGEYDTMDEALWTQRFEDGLRDAVQCHTIGDVPIGAYLSGGIDSSAITWMLSKQFDKPLETFSIHFTNESLDESPMFRNTAQHLGVQSSELTMSDAPEVPYIKNLEQCIYHLEQPQRMAVDIPHYLLSGFVQQKNYKVVYTGDGADEIMGGYDCYRQDAMRVWGNQLKNYKLRRRHYLNEYTQYFPETHVRQLLELHKVKNQRKTTRQFGCYPAWHDFWHITDSLLPGLFNQDFAQATSHNTQMQNQAAHMRPHLEGRHVLNQSLYIETKTRLPGWILWKSDRLSMAHGVEARVPFMDHKLAELMAAMPPIYKLNGMDEKYILKKIAAPHLPEHPTQYKKKAFYTPIREWFFTKQTRPLLDAYLSKKALDDSGIFDYQTVDRYIRALVEHKASNMDDHYQIMQYEWVLFSVLTTQMLHQRYVASQ